MNIDILKTELAVPKYAEMTAEEAAASLNVADRQRNRATMSGSEILEAIDPAEWAELLVSQKAQVLALCGIGDLNPFGKAEALLIDIFGPGATLNALAAARIESVSRATELGLGNIRAGDVQRARAEE